jgi:hypothetical protein
MLFPRLSPVSRQQLRLPLLALRSLHECLMRVLRDLNNNEINDESSREYRTSSSL